MRVRRSAGGGSPAPPQAGPTPPDDALPSSGSPLVPPVESVRLLVVAEEHHDADVQMMRFWAKEAGISLEVALDPATAAIRSATEPFHGVVVFLGDRPQEELPRWMDLIRDGLGNPRLIALSEHPSMEMVVRAEGLGVFEVLLLPLHRVRFLRALDRLRHGAKSGTRPLPRIACEGPHPMIGQDSSMLEVYKRVAQVAPTNTTVLIQGDSGSGKELVARAIHEHGPRAARPFVAVNCAAIPENLLESELFGHERGAFTGALTRRVGRIEAASGGTLFLDEIADMSLPLQAKILRVIQVRVVEGVGGSDPVPIDVRILSATNRDLREAIAEGKFREDLYFRLAVLTIRLPRLNARGDDLYLLVGHFACKFATQMGKQVTKISERALGALKQHDWVGNVRELRNIMERAILLVPGDTIKIDHLPDEFRGDPATEARSPLQSSLTLAEVEARHITMVLAQAGGQIGEAAEILGIHRNTLARKVRDYNL